MDTTTAGELTVEIYSAITPGTEHFAEFQHQLVVVADQFELYGIEDYTMQMLLDTIEMIAPAHLAAIATEALDAGVAA